MVNPQNALLTGLALYARFHSVAASSATAAKGAGGRAASVAKGMPKGLSTQAGRLTVDNINPSVVAASYAVRGPVLDRAMALQAQLSSDPDSVPFDEIIQW